MRRLSPPFSFLLVSLSLLLLLPAVRAAEPPAAAPAGIERRHDLAREQLKTAQTIDRSRLTAAEQVDLDLFIRRLASQVEGFRFPSDLLPLTQYGGIQPSASSC